MTDWYDTSGAPATAASGSSATIRGEFTAIETALAKLPTLTGNGSKLLAINSGGTAIEALSATLAVNRGGTGAVTLADGGIVLGSGTSAVTVTARPITGEVLVGQAAGDPVLESGDTLRASLGLTIEKTVQASVDQTLALADANTVIVNTSGTEHAITIPLNASVAFPTGTEIRFACQSTGKIAVGVSGGVTLVSISSNRDVKASGGLAYLVKTAADVWHLAGDLEA